MVKRVALTIAAYLVVALLQMPVQAEGTLVEEARRTSSTAYLNLSIAVPVGRNAQSARPRISKRKAVIIGAAIAGGAGAFVGTFRCGPDCAGGPAKGALVFGSIGAGLGAAAGLLISLLPTTP
jgi:hypothetical protein